MSHHVRGLSRLAFPQGEPQRGPVPVAPRRLHQDVPAAAVARLGDRAPVLSPSGGVLRRDEAVVAHELPGAAEAPEVARLRHQDHRRLGGRGVPES